MWISCNDNLPKIGKEVLTTELTADGERVISTNCRSADASGMWGGTNIKVLAWMPESLYDGEDNVPRNVFIKTCPESNPEFRKLYDYYMCRKIKTKSIFAKKLGVSRPHPMARLISNIWRNTSEQLRN